MQHTQRDLAWIELIKQAAVSSVRPEAIAAETGVSDRVARDVVKTAEEERILHYQDLPDGRRRWLPDEYL